MSAQEVVAAHMLAGHVSHPDYDANPYADQEGPFIATPLCRCGRQVEDYPAHVLDALSAGGFAVVELPREHGDDEPWPEFWGPWTTYAVTPNGLVRTDEGVPWMKPDDARAEAAALLAAADAADRAGDDGEKG